VAGFCEHGNESSGSIKKQKLSDYQLFKQCPALWSKQASVENIVGEISYTCREMKSKASREKMCYLEQ
jgi:hypothetical protein